MTTYLLLSICAGTTDAHISCTAGEPLYLEFPCPEGDPCRWELYGVNWHILGRRELPAFRGEGAERRQVYEFMPRVAEPLKPIRFLAVHAVGGGTPMATVNVHVTVRAKEVK